MTLTSLVWGNTATAFIFISLSFLCRIDTCCKSERQSTHAKHKHTVLYWPGERIDSPSMNELQLSFGMRSSNRILFACARRLRQDDHWSCLNTTTYPNSTRYPSFHYSSV